MYLVVCKVPEMACDLVEIGGETNRVQITSRREPCATRTAPSIAAMSVTGPRKCLLRSTSDYVLRMTVCAMQER